MIQASPSSSWLFYTGWISAASTMWACWNCASFLAEGSCRLAKTNYGNATVVRRDCAVIRAVLVVVPPLLSRGASRNWAMPVILCQAGCLHKCSCHRHGPPPSKVWALTKLLMTHPSLSHESSWEAWPQVWKWGWRRKQCVCQEALFSGICGLAMGFQIADRGSSSHTQMLRSE